MASKQRILIVDDDDNIAELISLYLTKEMYETKTAPDGEAALDAFHTFAPDLILLDLMLPGIDGAAVRQRIIMNPVHAKRTLAALNDNIKKYEQQFGAIEEPRMPMQGDTVPYDILGKA